MFQLIGGYATSAIITVDRDADCQLAAALMLLTSAPTPTSDARVTQEPAATRAWL